MRLVERCLDVAELHPAGVIAIATALSALIAFADWKTGPVSLGFLYIFPILLISWQLSRLQIVLAAAIFAVLRVMMSPAPGGAFRLIGPWLGFVCIGFYALELERGRRIRKAHLAEVEREVRLRQETERQFQILVETSPLAVFILDEKGRVLLANVSAHRLLGFEDQALEGEDIRPYLPVLGPIFDLDAPKMRTNVECGGHRKDGDVFLAQIWFATYSTTHGNRLAAIVWDGSDNLREREGAGLDSMLDTSRILVGAISHELRNLANSAVSAHHSLATLPGAAQSEEYHALGTVLKALERVASSGLQLAADRLMGVVNLYTVLDETRIVIGSGFGEAGASIEWKVEEGLPVVRGDQQSLLQVFLNLARNSLEAMVSADPKKLTVESGFERDLVVVRFRDTGSGVPNPDQLFRPFQPGAHTSGLGLYICRAILHSHGGDLRWEPQPKGTCFTVELWPVEANGEA